MTPEQVNAKIDLLRDNLEKLAQLPQRDYEEFSSDFRNLDSALHRLQTAIQAVMDLGSYAIARRGLPAPATNREILEVLEKAGLLPEGSTDRFGPMFGFRNRVVHLYDRIDSMIVFRILREERGDLKALMDLMLGLL